MHDLVWVFFSLLSKKLEWRCQPLYNKLAASTIACCSCLSCVLLSEVIDGYKGWETTVLGKSLFPTSQNMTVHVGGLHWAVVSQCTRGRWRELQVCKSNVLSGRDPFLAREAVAWSPRMGDLTSLLLRNLYGCDHTRAVWWPLSAGGLEGPAEGLSACVLIGP